MNLEGIDHIALSVADVERSAEWYVEILGFERRYEGMWNGIPVFIGKGTTAIALFPTECSNRPVGGLHRAQRGGCTDPRMLHLAFRASGEDFKTAQKELHAHGIPFSFEDHEISHSIYFRDPDGHKLEITTYEVPRR
jgi:catechol 2,3-dioxygenase-like lactoylglutathione lyase family enzyme